MEKNSKKTTYGIIIKELQTVITISYLFTVGIGMLFKYHKYDEFGINIFEYADVFDFLIAPFSDFFILLFTIATILFVYTVILLDIWLKKKWPKFYSIMNFKRDKKSWFESYRRIMYLLTFLIYLYFSADVYGNFTKKEIMEKNEIKIKLVNNEIKTGKLIGKTKDVIFLLNKESINIIPMMSAIREIELESVNIN